MAQYRCYFLSSEGKVFCAEDIRAETDQHALEKVRKQFAEPRRLPAFELWLETKRIYSEAGWVKTEHRPQSGLARRMS